MGIVTTFQRAFKADKLDPYPVEILKRVDRPTTKINEDQIQRPDEREHGFARARRGDFGPYIQREFSRFVHKFPLTSAMSSMTHYLAEYEGSKTATTQAPLPDDPVAMARHIKQTAYFLRSDIVGICKLPPYAVYTHKMGTGAPIELNHKYAIAIVIDQDWKTAEASVGNDWISAAMSYVGYSNSAFIAHMLADYIRKLGYPARAHHSGSYQVVVPPILLWAGIGELSRSGETVLSPFLGTRFKAAVVTTDLPLAVDKPIDFGLQDFCSKCAKCAQYCPSGSIPFGDHARVMYNGYERWDNDVEKCTKQRVGNKVGSSCGVCINVCPWNKPYTPFHRFIQWTMRNVPLARNFAIWGDDLMGYGIPKLKNKWWYDLEDVDGVLQVPRHSGERGNFKPPKIK